MRQILFLITFFAVAGLLGPASKEAAAQCTHFGAQGACPPEIPDGSTSISVNADGTINWNSGGVSGPCCAAPSGTETGAGLQNLSNSLGGSTFNYGPSGTSLTPERGNVPLTGGSVFDIIGQSFSGEGQGLFNQSRGPVCDFNGCGGDGLLGGVFGANPNSGYQCDAGGPGCGNDIWVGLPQPGFGECGPGGCVSVSPIKPLDFKKLPGTGPYAQNRTTGQVDPFGGAGSFFMDPVTGDITDLPKDRNKWPKRIKLADRLNDAYVNGEIGYPFGDPKWDQRSVQYYKDNPIDAPVQPLNVPLAVVPSPNFYQTEDRGTTPTVFFPPVLPQVFVSPYQQNRTTGGNIDPFGGGGNVFVDPRTGKSTELPEKEAEWPEKFKKAEKLNGLYVSGHIKYPFNDPNWETKPVSDFSTQAGSGTAESPSVILRIGGRRGLGIGSETSLSSAPTTTGTNITPQPGIPDGRIPVHPVQTGETLFRLALRYGVSAEQIAQANGISSDTPLTAGQVLTIPTSTPAPAPVASGAAPGTEQPQSGVRGGKSGRFGIGADTSLGSVGGLSTRFQVAKIFGVQAIVSFVRVNFDSKNENADLTNYVNAAVSNIAPPTPPPQVTPQPVRPTVTNLQKENFAADSRQPRIDQLDREGGETTYRVVFGGQVGPTGDPRSAEFDSRAAANRFSNMIKFEGMSFEDAAAAMPDDMKPTLAGTPATNLVDTLVTRVPNEFKAPTLTDRWDGEIHDIYVTNPATGQQQYFDNREHAEIFLGELRGGATWAEAQEIDLEATRVARNNGVVATSPDGLASATVRGGGRTPVGTATGGDAPLQINNRPAIIVNNPPSGQAVVTNTPPPGQAVVTNTPPPGQAVVTNTPPPGQAVVTNNPPPGQAVVTAITPPPQRPEGQSAGFMNSGLQGQAYRIEIIKTPDGKTLAVGTGEYANHVFGEVKETTVKIFGDWRREGPWKPPPPRSAAATQTGDDVFDPGGKIKVEVDTQTTGPAGNTMDSGDDTPSATTRTVSNLSPAQISNAQIRSQIANSDRDHMTQQFFNDGFESGDTMQWRSTGY